MSELLRICHDRIAARDEGRPLLRGPKDSGGKRAIIPDSRVMWPNGATLGVRFLEGTEAQKGQVREYAVQWSDYANIRFEFTDDPAAEIRVGFDSRDGAWSYMGNRALDYPASERTLNLGWVDEGTILHEFGHALGLGHEHQNPLASPIQWNEAAVIRAASGPPNFWDEATINFNILDKYSVNHYLRGTDFDPDSIMLYFFPDEWVLSGSGTRQNEKLSDRDKEFIGSAEAYPKVAVDAVALAVVDARYLEGEIGSPGEEDLYLFEVETEGEYEMETGGETDLVMSLYGPDSKTVKIAEDDDSGEGRNSRIARSLGPGTYYLQVRHYNRQAREGTYGIRVARIA